MTRRIHSFVVVVLITCTTIACGSSERESPTAPSTGATINGALAAVLAGNSNSQVGTVEVMGTSVSAPVQGDGRFVLAAVPAGSVRLRFAGPGTDATLPSRVAAKFGDDHDRGRRFRIAGHSGR